MAGTTAASFKASLHALITTALAAEAVQVEYADTPRWARRERVWMGPLTEGDHDPAAIKAGRRRRDESYDLAVMVEVIGHAPAPSDNEARAAAIATLIEEALADDPTVGGSTNVLWATVVGVSLETTETTDGPRSVLEMTVAARARLL